ncbi:MAG: hypothetical protein JWP91_2629 [Fibrobacteres bacterium]|nr:hypothetical protein [Fibrobacterota bacterium]
MPTPSIPSPNRVNPAACLAFALMAAGGGFTAPAGNLTLNDLAQQAQYIVVARPLAPSREEITFSEPGTEIPSLTRTVFRFKRGEVLKNVLGSELPDTLVVFEASTGAAVRAHRAMYLSEEPVTAEPHAYKSPIRERSLRKEKSVVLFLDEIRDDSTVAPRDRFELCAKRSYEKAANRKAIVKLLPKPAAYAE